MGKTHTAYKYVLFGVANDRPYYMAECVEQHPTDSLYPIPSNLVERVLAAAKAGAKYRHYCVFAFDAIHGAVWVFHAEVVHPEPCIEWDS